MGGDRASIGAIGDAFRAARAKRGRLRRRGLALAVLTGMVVLSAALPPMPLLVWNATASTPVGLYAITRPGRYEAGDIVLARMPEHMRMLAATRHYIPLNVPLVKRVAAAPGDRVCATGPQISVNGRAVAARLRRDRAGRPMPWWEGCILLRRGTLFLLISDQPGSFDGRYFGVTAPEDVIGKATLLWRR